MHPRHARRRTIRTRLIGAVLAAGLLGGTTAAVIVPAVTAGTDTGMHYHGRMHYHG